MQNGAEAAQSRSARQSTQPRAVSHFFAPHVLAAAASHAMPLPPVPLPVPLFEVLPQATMRAVVAAIAVKPRKKWERMNEQYPTVDDPAHVPVGGARAR